MSHLGTEWTARAGVNIALVKYWGKASAQDNLPAVGSLSLTLDGLGTTTSVAFDPGLSKDTFTLDGVAQPDDTRVPALLDEVRALAGIRARAAVRSINSVPTAAGLASSASGFAALGLAAFAAAGLEVSGPPSAALVDCVRRGSGSAPRSLLGGFVRLDRDSGGVRAVSTGSASWSVCIVVARVAVGPKDVSSRDGMAHSRDTSPFYAAWVDTHAADLDAAEAAIAAHDLSALGEVMEFSTMKMHACMLASRPALRYWAPGTLAALDAVHALRRAGVSAWATMDAGPHVKVLCATEDAARVRAALEPACLGTLTCGVGAAAQLIEERVP